MTETRTAVDKGNQEENSVVIIFLGSRERMMYGGMVMFRDLVIFSRRTGSLPMSVTFVLQKQCWI